MYHILSSNQIRIPTLAPRFEDETREDYDARLKLVHEIDASVSKIRRMHRARTNATRARKVLARSKSLTNSPAERKAGLVADKIAKQKIVAGRKMQKYFTTINIIGQRLGRLREPYFEDGQIVAPVDLSVWSCKKTWGSGTYHYETDSVSKRPVSMNESSIKTFYGHDAAKIQKTLDIRYSVASQLGQLLAAGDYRITGTDVLATREHSNALKEFFMFAHRKGCLPGVSKEDMGLYGWAPSNRDFSVMSGVPADKVAAQETNFARYLEQYNLLMPADCVKI